MKKLPLYFILAFLTFPLFAAETTFSLTPHAGTFLIDQSGNSFDIGLKGNVQVHGDKWQFSVGGEPGLFPGTICFSPVGFDAVLNNISFGTALADFSYRFTDSWSAKLALFGGGGKTALSDLCLLFGFIQSPFFGGAELSLSFPYELYLKTVYTGADVSFFSQKNDPIGKGRLDLAAARIGKNLNQFYVDAGFLYCGANGNVTITSAQQEMMLQPFSYAHGDTDLCFEFVTLCAGYKTNHGSLSFSIDSAVLLNCYSYIRYFFKTTYKNNLFFDGSIRRGEDTQAFCHFDSLIALDAKLVYSKELASSGRVDFSVDKKLLVPLLTKKTMNMFTEETEKNLSSTSASKIGRVIKTALLSGLSFEVAFYF